MVATPKHVIPVGTRYERLVVVANDRRRDPGSWQVANGKPGSRAVLVRCDCGSEFLMPVGNFISGRIKSCGCYRRARMAVGDVQGSHLYSRHGGRGHPSYDRWVGMVARCTKPTHKSYAGYGGRGIRVYGDWLEDPVAFCDWLDANLGPCPKYWSLDRIDNGGDYEPGNLRWASPSDQAQNRRPRKKVA